jgi:hypothetical protein
VYYESLGVVAAIVSWNYRTSCTFRKSWSSKRSAVLALHNAFSPILAAIFAGNGIVVKCSENVIWSTQWYVSAVKECLRICGQDPELVQVSDIRFLVKAGRTYTDKNVARLLLSRRRRGFDKIPMDPSHYVYWLRRSRTQGPL